MLNEEMLKCAYEGILKLRLLSQETRLTGQTAAVLTPSADSDQAGVTAAMSRPNGASDFDSQLLKAELERLLTMFESNKTEEGLMKAATQLTTRLQNIKTQIQLYQFCVGDGSRNVRDSRAIHVQPTSVGRRREGTLRGSARHRSGRPLAAVTVQADP